MRKLAYVSKGLVYLSHTGPFSGTDVSSMVSSIGDLVDGLIV